VQVIAFTTPAHPDWRWRIVDDAGEKVEESFSAFPSIAAAVAAGTRRLAELDVPDRAPRAVPYRAGLRLR
jgi:hypothetical protein